MTQTTKPAPTGTPTRPGGHGAASLARRWPTLLGVGLAALALSDLDDGLEFAFVLPLAAVGYLAVGVLDRRAATWPLLWVLVAAVVLLRLGGVDPVPVACAAGACLILAGLASGSLRRPGLPSAQAPGALAFTGLALVALQVSPDLGRYLVAAGLIGHAAWDALHWHAEAVVTRSFAEWCAVYDLSLGAGLLLLG